MNRRDSEGDSVAELAAICRKNVRPGTVSIKDVMRLAGPLHDAPGAAPSPLTLLQELLWHSAIAKTAARFAADPKELS